MAACKHKFVHRNTESFKRENGRYSYYFAKIDYYFCEKCLEEQSKKKEIVINDHEMHKIPDWAATITLKVAAH